MINIFKTQQPGELIQYKKQADAKYDGPGFTETKEEIRKSLLAEQGFLCAYCMVGLGENPSKVKIEHWQSQSRYPQKDLDYKNLLAACLGNSNGETHCDTSKSKFDSPGPKYKGLNYNPSDPDHDMARIVRFNGKGEISGDEPFQEDIKILNLNAKRLKRDRKAIWDSVTEALDRKKGKRTKAELEKWLEYWNDKQDGKLKSYCGVAIYYLKIKILKSIK